MKKVKFGDVRRALIGKGFIIALGASVLAVGVSTYLAYNQAVNKIGEIPNFGVYEPYVYEDESPVNKPQPGVPLNEQDPEGITPATPTDFENDFFDVSEVSDFAGDSEQTNNPIRSTPPLVMPVEGEIIQPFSGGELVKSQTLGVWKTHDGIDISAPLGTEVKAMTNGVVTEVYAEPLWGVCVVIDHEDGVFGCYFGLDKNVVVTVGQEVSAGDVIGAVGDTAEIEIAESPHLHFAVRKNDEWVDPVEFMSIDN